jgi:hypothetical protein
MQEGHGEFVMGTTYTELLSNQPNGGFTVGSNVGWSVKLRSHLYLLLIF